MKLRTTLFAATAMMLCGCRACRGSDHRDRQQRRHDPMQKLTEDPQAKRRYQRQMGHA